MYLVKIDNHTGYVKVDGEYDGIRAIPEFREVLNDPKLGVACLTAIALTVDYLTPIGFYSEKDRPYKAMERACEGKRRAFDWSQEKIQRAIIAYKELQYNPTIEEKTTLDEMLLSKLKEIDQEKEDQKKFNPLEEATKDNIQDYMMEYPEISRFKNQEIEFKDMSAGEIKNLCRKANTYVIERINQRRLDEKRQRDEERMSTLFKQLSVIKDLIKQFNKDNENSDIYADGPVRNGRKLTRLEAKALDKNSFYHNK